MSLFNSCKGLLELYKPKNKKLIRASEIDILEAISAHIKWKLRLNNYVKGISEEKLDPSHIEVDTKCVLGQWLYKSGVGSFGNHDDFHKLMETHAHFHQCAGNVVRLIQENKKEEAELIMSEEYHDYAKKIFVLLTSLHESMNKNNL